MTPGRHAAARLHLIRPKRLKALLVSLAFTCFVSLEATAPNAAEKTTIGAVEEVVLLPWGIRLPARIDTGATTSSLDARELKVDGNDVVFRLPVAYSGLELRLPVMAWRYIRSSEGRRRRPIVEMDLCLGIRRFHTQVTLADRSHLRYPLLVGRRVLLDNFVVDVSQSNTAEPSCQRVPSP